MKLKRVFFFVLVVLTSFVFLFSACSGTKEIRFLTPDGGTLLPVAKMFHDAPQIEGLPVKGEIVSGVAVESRLFAGTCEAAVAPVNLCADVYQRVGTYVLAGIVSWGNNYILSTDGSVPSGLTDLRGEVLYAWGAEAVPGKTLKTMLSRNGIAYETVSSHDAADSSSDKVFILFMADAGGISQEISKPGSRVRYAMLPEPAVTALNGASLANGKTPAIVLDMQTLWKPDSSSLLSYPQAGLMLKKEFVRKNPAAAAALLETVKASADYCLQNAPETAALAKTELQSVALPAVPVVQKYILGRGQDVMRYKSVNEAGVKESVSEYLEAIMGTAPDSAFYFNG